MQPISTTTYNAANQLTQWGTATLTYDANGNMLSDGSNGYTWDARNHLVSTLSGASFQYDPFGRRASKTISGVTTNYLYVGANIVQELSGGTPSANLLSRGVDKVFARTDSAGARNFLADALGSTLALTDSTGAVQTQYTYEPFGNAVASGFGSANPYQYTGRENDGTGLYFYRSRYYHGGFQRFIGEDLLSPIFPEGNLYTYSENEPTILVDPSGAGACSPGGVGASAAAGGSIGGGWGLGQAVNQHNFPTSTGQARLGFPDPSQPDGWNRTFHLDAPKGDSGYHLNADSGPQSYFDHTEIP